MIIAIILVILFFIFLLLKFILLKFIHLTFESPVKRAGKIGEHVATQAISKILHEDDLLLNNIEVSFDGKNTELDNVIINKYGVFIIEVKNYKGTLNGNEDDYEWDKYKDDGYGNIFEKKVKNPIKQVKRQTYIVANYLKDHGINVWVEGYALLIHNNSPIDSPYVLTSLEDIDKAIHTFDKNRLSTKTVEIIHKLLIN